MMFSPFAEARSDLYRVMNYTASGEQYVTRNVGLAGAEMRWPFMRPGDHVNWLVEPIAMAALGSYGGNDKRIPNEDSQSLEIDDSNVFRPAGVGNYDLWEGGPRASLGVRATAMTDMGTATATIGRRWQENADPTFSPITNLGDESSDWVASMSADLGPQFGGALRLRLDDKTLSVNRFDASVHGKIDRLSGVVRYFKVDPSLTTTGTPTQEVAGTVGLKLTNAWDVSYGLRRDLSSDINLSQNAHLTYRDNCMFLEFVYTRTETQDRSLGPSEGFQIRVGLSTLGVFGGS
jgi:LPS-assembly protein